jgi:DNA helicase-2/ATP-dependent DNA helicase PcrA
VQPRVATSAATYARLTREQRAAVEHELGPAVALGVAGSGKTTVAVYRVARLVEKGLFAPDRIVLAALNSATAADLRKRLARLPGCQGVPVITLHTLGHNAVQAAYEMGHLRTLAPDWARRVSDAGEVVLKRALNEARRQDVDYAAELDTLEADDFLHWVTVCKGNLRYPDPSELTGVLAYNEQVGQATPPEHMPWYLDLYALFERIRLRLGLISADDQLLTGWEVLYQHGDVVHRLRDRFDCLIVDEFQDINRAQAEMLDILAHPHLNYMATRATAQARNFSPVSGSATARAAIR